MAKVNSSRPRQAASSRGGPTSTQAPGHREPTRPPIVASDEIIESNRVSWRMRQLEPLLPWAVGAYMLWLTILVMPRSVEAWVAALFAACVGAWAKAFPATHQLRMFARGALLLAAALPLHAGLEGGGPAGILFFWPLAVSSAYALLLRRSWSALLALLALAEFAAACWLHSSPGHWQWIASCGAALIVFPMMASAFGRSMRMADAQLESAMLDRQTRLYNETGFFSYGAELLATCRARRQPLTMVLLNGADLRDVQEMVGKHAADKLLRHAVHGIVAALPPEGLAARVGQVEFGLLLPATSAARAEALVRHHLGDPPQVVLNSGSKQIAIVLDMVAMEAQPNTPNLEDLYDRLYSRLVRMRRPLDAPPSIVQPELDSFMPDLQRDVSETLPMKLERSG